MNRQDMNDINQNGRYYANPAEEQIRIQGLRRYFSYPERSQNRNQIAKEVSAFLRAFSPHWSHRAVRLWFNNNKHTYFNENEKVSPLLHHPMQIPVQNFQAPPLQMPQFQQKMYQSMNMNMNINLNQQQLNQIQQQIKKEIKTEEVEKSPLVMPSGTTVKVRSPIQINQTKKINSPPQVNSQMSVPGNINSPIQINTPIKMNSTLQINPPMKINSPIQINTPIKMNSTLQINPPMKINSPIQINTPIKMNSTLQINQPMKINSPIQINTPIKMNSTLQINQPMKINSPIQILPTINSPDKAQCNNNGLLQLPPIDMSSKVLQNKQELNNGASNKVKFPSLNKEQIYLPLNPELPIDKMYLEISTKFTSLKRTQDGDPELNQIIDQFDSLCNKLKAKYFSIEAERIDPHAVIKRFPFIREPSTEFHLVDQIPESLSNLDLLSDIPFRSPSFSHQLYASESHPTDQLSSNTIWQARHCSETKISYFESTTISNEIAAYVYVQFQEKSNRVISFRKFTNRKDSKWGSINLGINTRIESMIVDKETAWVMTNNTIGRALLNDDLTSNRVSFVNIPPQPNTVSAYKDNSILISYPSSPNLTLVRNNLVPTTIHTQYKGISYTSSLDNMIICSIPLSSTLRMIDQNGTEMRTFIGHCAPILGITSLTNSTFATRADDYTIRIWDVRKRSPIATITNGRNSVLNIAGSEDFVIAGFNRKVGVIDLRGDSFKPILGVVIDDYDAISLNYNQSEDTLAMFGIVEKESNKDSMLFLGNDGQSRQRIFRMYRNFIGIQNI